MVFKVKDEKEFQGLIDKNDVRIPRSIVKAISDNMNNIKQNITVISIESAEPKITYNVSLEKKHYYETLQDNLKFFIENEQYEECNGIVAMMNSIKNKKSITNIIQSLK